MSGAAEPLNRAPAGGAPRNVASWLTFETDDDTQLALQVAVARSAGAVTGERLILTLDGAPMEPVAEWSVTGGSRVHVVETPRGGTLRLAYEASVTPYEPAALLDLDGPLVFDPESIAALHQSAYCRSDLLAGFAAAELGAHRGESDLAQRVATWVFERLAYQPGASGPLDSAVDTLLTNAGVCRDFAHLAITLCRALGIPARLAAVYAPGLTPMDFHAVVEVRSPGGWHVLDATRLAPRSSLVRITTGRDAADTAFATTLRGNAELVASEVFAVVDGPLPADDHRSVTVLA
ncbi:MAG: hypothetical protein JWM47_718 [Acidimicrobiales bacterium]|nr:hypothetical protein [Acidimicrobiales bacterium]